MHTNKTSSKNILSEFFLKPKTMMKDGQRNSGMVLILTIAFPWASHFAVFLLAFYKCIYFYKFINAIINGYILLPTTSLSVLLEF